MSLLVDITNDVASIINAAGLGVTAEVAYLPAIAKPTAAYQVYVQPSERGDDAAIDRSPKTQSTYGVMVNVIRSISASGNNFSVSEVDDAIDLTDRIADALRQARKAAGAPWLSSSQAPIYDDDELKENQIFNAALTIRYRKVRS